MSSTNMLNDVSTITGVQFGIYSPEELLKRSVAHITESTLYDSSGEPKIAGLFDPRMGYIEQNKKCKTCEQTYIKCPGHFGHIELAKPVFNMQYDGEIVKLLKCFCIKCSRILVNINNPTVKHIIASTKGNNKERFDKMFKFITGKVMSGKVKVCGANANKGDGSLFDNGGCGAIQPTKYINNIRKSLYISVTAEWKYDTDAGEQTTVQQLSAEIVLAIFKRISEEHALAMGLSPRWCMPSWLIITVLPVVPPCVRPSVRQYNNQRSEDDLTHLYNDIVKINNNLKDQIEKGLSPSNMKVFTDAIQVKVSTMFNNDIKGIPSSTTRSGRPMKTFAERLGGKEGRIRSNLMGKRVDFSARSVISPDPNLLISELGIPKKIAMNLTFPEVVNKYNIGRMYELVRNGNNTYPGAKSWRSVKNGKTRYIEYNNAEIILEHGDVVNRHLINGDIVLFNRQPSLHKMSMLALEVRVIEGNTFRINPDICEPFNADFDGDEMNMHVPQSIRTAMELKELAASYKHIVSPSTSSAIIRPLQDNLLGLYKITDDTVFFSHTEVMNILTTVSGFKGVLPEPAVKTDKKALWTGKQVYSIILPPINFNDGNVIIENGILKKGQIPKGVSNAIVLIIFNDFGYKEAARYINDLQKITSRYLIRSGYSVGISDLLVHPDIKKRNEAVVVEAKNKVAELTKRVHLNILEDVNEGLDEIYDGQVQAICGAKFNEEIIAKTLKTVEPTNRINYIVKSGAKGDPSNLQQMMCLLGQQAIDGKRVPLNFHERTLPHYPRYENGIESRGYITSSFLDGLSPQEFFFHAMSGREGIIDTAVKTANSGYLQRRLVKSTEDLKVSHDLTVRASNNDIVEFCYGYDGFNSNSLEQQKTGFLKITVDKLRNNYYMNADDKFEEYIDRSAITRMMKNNDWKKTLTSYNKNVDRVVDILHTNYPKFFVKLDDLQLNYPVKFERLISNAVNTYKLTPTAKCDINPVEVINAVEELIDHCSINGRRNHTLEILAYDYLSPKNLLMKLHFNRVAFEHVLNYIKMRFKNSLADGGEMVGPLAAQSIGEKSTQLTLNSVDWDTEILIAVDGIIQTPQIGEFIDNYFDMAVKDPILSKKIQYLENEQLYIPLDDGHDYMSMSCDNNGVVMWTKLEAITRHPVVNEDGSDMIVEVVTNSGRTIKCTLADSLIAWNEKTCEYEKIGGEDIVPGTQLALMNKFALHDKIKTIDIIDMKDYLSPTVHLYYDEVLKALDLKKQTKFWFQQHHKAFTTPFTRGDTLGDAFVNGKNSRASEYKAGFVYPFKIRKGSINPVPAIVNMDNDFGYFCGAYLADGMICEATNKDGSISRYQLCISKQHEDFIAPIDKFLTDKWGISKHVQEQDKYNKNDVLMGHSTDHRWHSLLLCEFIYKLFGTGSDSKGIPSWFLQTPDEFLIGLISGYFSGDGCVDEKGYVTVSSISKSMLETIAIMLARFEIYTHISKTRQNTDKFPNAKEYIHNLRISSGCIEKFNSLIKLTIKQKDERLTSTAENHRTLFKTVANTVLDPIKSVTKIRPMEHIYDGVPKRWVYDVTVEKTHHFGGKSLIVAANTFHKAGSAEASSVTQGVTRLNELLGNTKNPKCPQTVIYLDETHRFNAEMAEKIQNNIQYTTIGDILLSDAIYLEPNNNFNDILPEDREMLEIYKVFSELDPQATQIPENPWLIRLEFDRKKIIKQKITMDDVYDILKSNYPESILMFMDDNAGKLVFRIRIPFQTTQRAADDIIHLKDKMKQIREIPIKGIEGITRVTKPKETPRYVKEGVSFVERNEYVMKTEGSNLFEILMRDGIDTTRTYSIDPNEMFAVFGIEAARYMIEDQIKGVLEASRAMTSPRHVALLCNKMNRQGDFMSVNRHGINKENIGPLAKCSFEETTDQLKFASMFGEFDNIKGVSSNIMVGQVPKCGTGDSEIMLDEEMLLSTIKTEQPEGVEEAVELTEQQLNELFNSNKYCENNVAIKFNLHDIQEEDLSLEDIPTIGVM